MYCGVVFPNWQAFLDSGKKFPPTCKRCLRLSETKVDKQPALADSVTQNLEITEMIRDYCMQTKYHIAPSTVFQLQRFLQWMTTA